MTEDKEQVLAYYPQVLQDIRDIKARPWNFLTMLVVIVGGVVAFETERVVHVRHLLFFVVFLAAAATAFMAVHSFIKIEGRRARLHWIYDKFPYISEARGITTMTAQARRRRLCVPWHRHDRADTRHLGGVLPPLRERNLSVVTVLVDIWMLR